VAAIQWLWSFRRFVAALLHIIRCLERMGDQCANIAKLVRLSGDVAPKDADILDTIERMGQAARSQLAQGTEAFATRNVTVAQTLVGLDGEINRLNGEIFNRGGRGRRRPRGSRVGDVDGPRRARP